MMECLESNSFFLSAFSKSMNKETKMRRFRNSLSILVLLYAAVSLIGITPSMAEDTYFGGGIGVVEYPDADLDVSGSGTAELSSDTGIMIGISLGTSKYDPFRFEGELAYRNNHGDKITSPGGGVIGTADVQSGGLLFNGFYDLKISSSITPFIGVGAGFSFVDIDKDIDDYDTVFAYQFIAGVGFDIHNKLKLDLSYKYFATTTSSFEVNGIGYDLDYGTHTLQIGLRYYSTIF